MIRPLLRRARAATSRISAPPSLRIWQGFALMMSLVLLVPISTELRWILAPLLILLNTGLFLLASLWRREGRLPLFEVGTLFGAAVVAYSCVPLVNYIAGGLRWVAFSDNRLYYWAAQSPPDVVGRFAFRYVAFLVAFVAAYLLVRGRTESPRPLDRTPPASGTILVIALIGLTGYFLLLRIVFGVDTWASYERLRAGAVGIEALPLLVQQLSNNLQGCLIVVKLALLVLLFAHWRRSRWVRVAISLWLGFETIATVSRLGSRTELVLLLLGALCLYHRFARPLSFRVAAVAGSVLLISFLGLGVLRDFGQPQNEEDWPLLAATNEFQALFGTAYDIEMRQRFRMIETPPWQIHVADILMLVPQQTLPIRKVDPSTWYLEESGFGAFNTGLMFGTMAQASIGLGWIEALLRGAMIGVVFAMLHRLYVRRSHLFWMSVFYVYLCVWSYYSFRASSFYWVYFILYRFVPVLIFVWMASRAVSAARRGRRSGMNPISTTAVFRG